MEHINNETAISAIYSNASDLSSLVSTPSSLSGGLSDEESSVRSAVPISLIEKKLLVSDDATLDMLNDKINECKTLVLSSKECSDERKWLVRYLVELRYRAQELKDARDNLPTKMGLNIVGHHFKQYDNINPSVKQYCDHCSGVIWSVMQGSFVCRDCSYICHSKCVNSVIRICVHIVVSEKASLEMSICPEKGLAAQRYRCAECRANIGFNSRWSEPRLCDYSGNYFCTTCHWNNVSEIPARIVHNWDWEKRLVSQAAYQLLALSRDKPLINLNEINKNIFAYVTEIDFVRKMRRDLIVMRQYLMVCQVGSNLISRELLHLVESPNLYSIQDLEMTKDGILATKLVVTTEKCRSHILDCQICCGKGYHCELCQNKKAIFPFDSSAVGCEKCNSLFHRLCWTTKNFECPKCLRIIKRYETEEVAPDQDLL